MGTPSFDFFSNRPQRQLNFFQPQQVDWNTPAPDADEALYKSMFGNGSNPAVQKYLEYLTQIPKMEDYKPSWGRKILAGLAGFGTGWFNGANQGIQTAMGINRQPYMDAMERYQSMMPMYKEPISLYNQENEQKLNLYKAIIDARNKADESKRGWFNADTSRMGEERERATPRVLTFGGRDNLYTFSGGLNDKGPDSWERTIKASADRQKAGFDHDKLMSNINFGNQKALQNNTLGNQKNFWDYQTANPHEQVFKDGDSYDAVSPKGARNIGGVKPNPNAKVTPAQKKALLEQAFTEIGMKYPTQVKAFYDFENKAWKDDRDPQFPIFIEKYAEWLANVANGRKGKAPIYNPSREVRDRYGWE